LIQVKYEDAACHSQFLADWFSPVHEQKAATGYGFCHI